MIELKKEWKNGPIVLNSGKNAMIQAFTSRIIPYSDYSWRVWYSVHYLNRKHCYFGYAEGKFGKSFKKTGMRISQGNASSGLNITGVPKHWNLLQPVYIMLPDGGERIYFWAHASEGICRYLLAESEDGINFHVNDIYHPCLYHPNDRAVSINTLNTADLTLYCHSRRRVRPAHEPEASADMISNDATNVYLQPDGTFELYTVELFPVDKNHRAYMPNDPGAGLLRVIQRRTSIDGINWTPGKVILEPDANDPDDLQFYYLSVTHTTAGRIGALGYYRADRGTMDIEFCFSQDGVHWERPFRGAGIERPKGIECIYAPNSLVEKDGKYFLFHTDYNYTHHKVLSEYARGSKSSQIAVSTIEADKLHEAVCRERETRE